jgi:hypothetical protein
LWKNESTEAQKKFLFLNKECSLRLDLILQTVKTDLVSLYLRGFINMAKRSAQLKISVDVATAEAIVYIAERESKSISTVAKELLREAVERREDMDLADLARQRDALSSGVVEHENAWS